MKQLSLFLCLLLGLAFDSHAQTNPTTWTITAEKVSDGEYKIMLQVKLEGVWAIYSQYLESDEGPIATSINFEKNEDIEWLGAVEELGEKIEGYDEMFEMNIAKYKKEVVFTQTVKAEAGTIVKGNYEFMVCNDERCLPPREESFEVELK